MYNTIYPCLLFNGQAKEAAEFYCSVFGGTIALDTPLVVHFNLGGQKFMGLHGGPQLSFNPSVSFFVVCETEEETTSVWEKLLEGGSALMPLDKYPWSEQYGWVQDRYGLSWQIAFGKLEDVAGQKFTPSLLFTASEQGKAEAAVHFYTSVFDHSSVTGILKYENGENNAEGMVKHAQFTVSNCIMMAMDNPLPQEFTFNEAVSFVVDCGTQDEIDHYWDKLTDGGQESMCGWLKDRFGVSWQIVPSVLGKLMTDQKRFERVLNEVMKMKKLDIKTMEQA